MAFYLARMEGPFRSSFLYEGSTNSLDRFWLRPRIVTGTARASGLRT